MTQLGATPPMHYCMMTSPSPVTRQLRRRNLEPVPPTTTTYDRASLGERDPRANIRMGHAIRFADGPAL
jgi:hypothetical protein